MSLESLGYTVLLAEDGERAMESIQAARPDLIIADVMMPKVNGFQICRRVKSDPGTRRTPVILLTARSGQEDIFWGKDCGADDYITKPFSLREVEARIKSVLRRALAATTAADGKDETPIVRGQLRVDPVRREVTIADRHVDLTPKEFDLLRLFASNPGRVFPRKYLLEKIWDYSYEGYDRTIDSHINRLRAKIEENPENPQLVLTVWGIGYKFTDAE